MKIYIASDHAAYKEKEELISILSDFQFVDLGTNSPESVHYPQYAIKVAKSVLNDEGSAGILLCGTGIGMSMVANKFGGIRAALCRSIEDGKLAREHNNANILCLGGRVTPVNEMKEIVLGWYQARFAGGRHLQRIEMVDSLGE